MDRFGKMLSGVSCHGVARCGIVGIVEVWSCTEMFEVARCAGVGWGLLWYGKVR